MCPQTVTTGSTGVSKQMLHLNFESHEDVGAEEVEFGSLAEVGTLEVEFGALEVEFGTLEVEFGTLGVAGVEELDDDWSGSPVCIITIGRGCSVVMALINEN